MLTSVVFDLAVGKYNTAVRHQIREIYYRSGIRSKLLDVIWDRCIESIHGATIDSVQIKDGTDVE